MDMRDWQKICERTIYRPHCRKKFGMVEERGIYIEILRGEVMWSCIYGLACDIIGIQCRIEDAI